MDERFEQLYALREEAKKGRDPTTPDETLSYLLSVVKERKPSRILEIGAAEGLTSCAMLLTQPQAHLTAIELTAERARSARENFRRFGVEERTALHEGDAGRSCPFYRGNTISSFWTVPKYSTAAIWPTANGS